MTLRRSEKMSPCVESQGDDAVIALSLVIMRISMGIVTRVSAPIVILRYPVLRAQLVIYIRIQDVAFSLVNPVASDDT